MKKFLGLLTVFVLIAYSTMPVSAGTNKDMKKYTGQEIFKGIFLAQGKVGEELADRWQGDQVEVNNSKETIEFTDRIIEKMDEQEQNYFKNLESAIYSKNHIKTEELIKEGGELFMDLVEKDSVQSTSEEIETAKDDAQAASFVAVAIAAVVVTTAVGYSHAGVVTFYAYAAAVQWGPGTKSDSTETQSEMAVKHIIETLN